MAIEDRLVQMIGGPSRVIELTVEQAAEAIGGSFDLMDAENLSAAMIEAEDEVNTGQVAAGYILLKVVKS